VPRLRGVFAGEAAGRLAFLDFARAMLPLPGLARLVAVTRWCNCAVAAPGHHIVATMTGREPARCWRAGNVPMNSTGRPGCRLAIAPYPGGRPV
jgi:hypothetical protein